MILVDPRKRQLPEQDPDVLYMQLDRYQRAHEAQREWAVLAARCQDFLEGKQWDPADEAGLLEEGRPVLKFNKIRPLVNLVMGYQRQNQTQAVFKPGNDALATQDRADTISKIVSSIYSQNDWQHRKAEMFRDGLTGGRGYVDIRLNFERNYLGDVAIDLLDPFSVYPDPEASEYEPAKWNFVNVGKWLSLVDIELQYGTQAMEAAYAMSHQGAITSNIGADGDLQDDVSPPRYFGLWKFFGSEQQDGRIWGLGPGANAYSVYEHIDRYRKTVRVIDQQHWKTSRVRYFIDLETGAMKQIPDGYKEDRIRAILQWAQAKTPNVDVIDRVERRVRWTVTAADTILHDGWSPYRTFTVVPYFPYFRRGKTMGLVEDLIDPQREINKRRSAEIHIVGSVAHSGWMYEENALDPDQEENLETQGSRPGINVKYKKGANKPERLQPNPPPLAMERLEQRATADLKEISGINDSALGQVDIVQSGVAIKNRQQQAVVGIEAYMGNLTRTERLVALKVLEIVQDHYTEPRLFRWLGEDGKEQITVINERDAAGAILNDISTGTYDVAIDDAPASATFQQQEFDQLLDMFKNGLLPPDMIDVLIQASQSPQKRVMLLRLQQLKAAAQAAAARAAGGVPGSPGAPPAGAGGQPPGAGPAAALPPPGAAA